MLAISASRSQVVANSLVCSSRPASQRALVAAPVAFTTKQARRALVVRAQADDDEDEDVFEARLAALKTAKGATPTGAGKKAVAAVAASGGGKKKGRDYDYTDESVVFETPPARGDLFVNLALGATLLWLPLSIAAVGRGLFVRYRFTDRRISCITSAPWQTEQLDAAYQEVKTVISIGRGVGLWGDMVVTLNDGSKIEMRALPRFKEMEAYIIQRRDELTGGGSGGKASDPAVAAAPKGFGM